MIVSISVEDIIREGKTEISCVYNEKTISPMLEVVCNECNIEEGLKYLKGIFTDRKTNILHISYEGDVSKLESVLFSEDYSNVPIVLKKNLSEIELVDLLVGSMPKNVLVVVKVDMEIPNVMKVVNDYSQKYSNISFCGKGLISLKGCRLGCTEKRIKDITSEEGCYRGYTLLDIKELEDVRFTEACIKKEKVTRVRKEKEPVEKVKKDVTPKPKTEKVTKPKTTKVKKSKPVSSLLARRLNKEG